MDWIAVLRCRLKQGEWSWAFQMTRTHEKVRYSPKGKGEELTSTSAADSVEQALRILEGRWKLVILFHLFGGKVPTGHMTSESCSQGQRVSKTERKTSWNWV